MITVIFDGDHEKVFDSGRHGIAMKVAREIEAGDYEQRRAVRRIDAADHILIEPDLPPVRRVWIVRGEEPTLDFNSLSIIWLEAYLDEACFEVRVYRANL